MKTLLVMVAGAFLAASAPAAAPTVTGKHPSITFSAKLLEDGTLSGSLTTEIGDMNWTAKRVDPKDKS
jgi:polyisoprenoid-binding protein YceI